MYRNSREEGFGAEVKRRILLGTYALSAGYYDAYYLKAQQVRRLLAEEFLRAFAEVDAIVTPTAPTPAFKLARRQATPGDVSCRHLHSNASLAGICGSPCLRNTQAGLPVACRCWPRICMRNRVPRGAAVEAAQHKMRRGGWSSFHAG